MWHPNTEKTAEIITLLKQSQTSNNEIQKDIYHKVAELMKDPNISKTLIYILTSSSQPNENRKTAAAILQNQMNVDIKLFSCDSIEYLKLKIISCYVDRNNSIRHSVMNLINSFIKHRGIDIWFEILEVIESTFERKENLEQAMETLNIIIEYSKELIEDKILFYMRTIIGKLLASLKEDIDEQLTKSLLHSLYIILEHSKNLIKDKMEEIVTILKRYSFSDDNLIKLTIGKCWLIVIHMEKEIAVEYYKELFNFFLLNFNDEKIDQSFISAEFFLFLIVKEDFFLKNNENKDYFKGKLAMLLPFILHFMKLTDNDMHFLENKYQNDKVSDSSGNGSSGDGSSGDDSSSSEYSLKNYNADWTLRKCCCHLIDNISVLFPKETLNVLRPFLENDLQAQEFTTKERAILAFGAIGQGSYRYIIHHLKVLIPFLIRELQHPNKFVRAISCWTLSRYTNYILFDNQEPNQNDLFKDYLSEILKKFLDEESMVRESAGTAFQLVLEFRREIVEPYLFDVLKVIISVFDKYRGMNLLSLYDILIFLMENYSECFKNQYFAEDIAKCIVQKWYDLVKSDEIQTLPSFFDVIITIIQVCGNYLLNYCEYFLSGCLKIIESNFNENIGNTKQLIDKDLLGKSIDTISALAHFYPEYIIQTPMKKNLLQFLFRLLALKDLSILQSTIALSGYLLQADNQIMNGNEKKLIHKLIEFITLPDEIEEFDNEMESVLSNAVLTLKIYASINSTEIAKSIHPIVEQLIKLFNKSKTHITLTQNISICIGRLALFNSEVVGQHIEAFLKDFCLCLHNVDSIDKQEAFKGICAVISSNPVKALSSLTYFIEAVSDYEGPPNDLEAMFHNILQHYCHSYPKTMNDLIASLSIEAKDKLLKRFTFQT